MSDRQTCPRRLTDMGPWERVEGLDTWEPGRGMSGGEAAGLSCSFCGSLHPDRFMELIRDGWIVGPTGKSYKAYVDKPYTADEIAAGKQRWIVDSRAAKAIRAVGERDGKTGEQIIADLEAQWAALPHNPGRTVAKFYYQHLSEDQAREFVDLMNSGRMRIGYPGHLYVLPFFAQRRTDPDTE